MIIVVYQGIDKSTLIGPESNCIDLESSNFFVDGKRDENWYKIYVSIAVDLSKQGFTVFTSSHKVVRDELLKYDEKIYIITPSLALEEEWVNKLECIYNVTKSDKDYKAYINAKLFYKENVCELIRCDSFDTTIIPCMTYSLKDIINELK